MADNLIGFVGNDDYKREQREENMRLSKIANMLEQSKTAFNSIGANMAESMERERQLQIQLDWQVVADLCGWDKT